MARLKNRKRARLAPCPFDGGDAQLLTQDSPKPLPHYVECTMCHARTTCCRLPSIAVTLWNRRAQ